MKDLVPLFEDHQLRRNLYDLAAAEAAKSRIRLDPFDRILAEYNPFADEEGTRGTEILELGGDSLISESSDLALVTFDILAEYSPFADEEGTPETEVIELGGDSLIPESSDLTLVTFDLAFPDSYRVWISDWPSGALRCRSVTSYHGMVTFPDSFNESRYSPKSVPLPSLRDSEKEARTLDDLGPVKTLLEEVSVRNRLVLLASLDDEALELASRAHGVKKGAVIPAPLLYNFFNGTLPGIVVDREQARKFARQALQRMPGIGILALRLSIVDATELPASTGNVLTRIANGQDPIRSFETNEMEAPYILEGMPTEAVEGLFRENGMGCVATVINSIVNLRIADLPKTWDEAALLTKLNDSAFLNAAMRQPGGWKNCPDQILGFHHALDDLGDFRGWLHSVSKTLAKDPSAVNDRLQNISLRRWVDASNRWHEQYARWLDLKEAELFPERMGVISGSWPPLFLPGTLASALPEGWTGAEILDDVALKRHGVEQVNCVGSYTWVCEVGASRILALQCPGEAPVTVEIALRDAFEIAQCSGPNNEAPSESARDATRQLVRALNADLPRADTGAPRLLDPATLAIMRVAPRSEGPYVDARLRTLLDRMEPAQLERDLAPFLPFRFEIARPGQFPTPDFEEDIGLQFM